MEVTPIYNRLLIFDGSHCLHRALCQPDLYNMINLKNKRTGGILGVLKTINKVLKTYNYFPIVVFDGGLSERRLNIYPNYKKHQENLLQESMMDLNAMTEEQILEQEYKREYNTQRNDLCQLLPMLGIPVINIQGWEGDDIIYIITKMAVDSIVVSDDRDLLQLIHESSDNDIRRCRIRRDMTDQFWDMNTLKEMNVDIQEYIACKSICGDNSDNIPSACYQVGEKTAPGLYHLYESIKQNNETFPTTEEELSKYCKKYDIGKRKAYMNFNENQFLTNLLLTDISLIDDEITPSLVEYIGNIINDVSMSNDIVSADTLLKEFEINSVDAEKILNKVIQNFDLLSINNIEKCKNIIDINKPNKLF